MMERGCLLYHEADGTLNNDYTGASSNVLRHVCSEWVADTWLKDQLDGDDGLNERFRWFLADRGYAFPRLYVVASYLGDEWPHLYRLDAVLVPEGDKLVDRPDLHGHFFDFMSTPSMPTFVLARTDSDLVLPSSLDLFVSTTTRSVMRRLLEGAQGRELFSVISLGDVPAISESFPPNAMA